MLRGEMNGSGSGLSLYFGRNSAAPTASLASFKVLIVSGCNGLSTGRWILLELEMFLEPH